MSVVYSFEYSRDYYPPMPVVELAIGLPAGELAVELSAIVDSGADATMIPVEYLQQVGARRSRKASLRGVTGGGMLVDLHVVAIQVGAYQQGFLEVVGVENGDEAILGRDVLNHLTVTLNGPAATVEMS